MSLFILIVFLLAINWLFSALLGTFPLEILNYLGSLLWIGLGLILLIIISWFLGD
jgi:hypothetical protein